MSMRGGPHLAARNPDGVRVGIDTGGTFTDLVVLEPNGRATQLKLPSTPDDPARGLGEGLRAGAPLDGGRGGTAGRHRVAEASGASSEALSAAKLRRSAAGRTPSGCGITSIGSSGQPLAEARPRASPKKTSVAISTAGVPRLVISIVSWTLHDVQDPQSPEPQKTRWQRAASSS